MDYQAAIEYIESFTDYEKSPGVLYTAANYDLKRMEELLHRLGNPHLKARTVHVAGTKGKGSTAAMTASALTASGVRTGLFTSPHLHSIRERMAVDGEQISPEDMARLMTQLQPVMDSLHHEGKHGGLTTFEILTALAFAYFAERGAEFQVVEAGLGGRLDATNVVTPAVCVITSISLDHTEVLGDSVEKIAIEKAGIIKPGASVVCAPQRPEAQQVVQWACLERGAKLTMVGSEVTWRKLDANEAAQLFEVDGRLHRYRLEIPLLGEYQLENAATAVAALEELMAQGAPVSGQGIVFGLKTVRWPGRLEIIGRNPTVVVDGAHNRYSAMRLREAVQQHFEYERLVLIIGTSSDKDISGIVAELAPLSDEVIVTRSRHPRAAPVDRLISEFGRCGKEATGAADVPSAVARARALARPGGLVLATGSLFVVAEALDCMKGEEGEPCFPGPRAR
ncbi:MAG: bifunctional folylpolyglutamate synthase/dihydrofolate synthase [Chloroflexi bacterium]|nr:bifunctional folylpolyglutamate synthase/dihydrofolate synthase [Chloroflexota bacterium]